MITNNQSIERETLIVEKLAKFRLIYRMRNIYILMLTNEVLTIYIKYFHEIM